MNSKLQTVLLFVAMMVVLVDYTEAAEPILHPWDYATHAIGGAIAVEVFEPKTLLGTIMLTGAIGASKEMMDKNFDTTDAIAWVVGGVLYREYKVRIKTKDDGVLFSSTINF